MSTDTNHKPVIVWFREDLRLSDNPALVSALETGAPLILLFVLDDETDGLRQPGGASRWWLFRSLKSLAQDIAALGGRLILRRGESRRIVEDILSTSGADRIFWNRRYGEAEVALDKAMKADLGDQSVDVHSFNGRLINEPWTIKTKSGGPFRVFTPFWKACNASAQREQPLPSPNRLPPYSSEIASDEIEPWDLMPSRPNWASDFARIWTPGEHGARLLMDEFFSGKIADYADRRDEPGTDVTSRLSPHLAFGEISPRQIRWVTEWPDTPGSEENKRKFLTEIGWREFAYHLLFHNPNLATVNLQSKFDRFEWAEPDEAFDAWKRGQTGYPLVDAAMRQLWQTGWMHNRCRMVVGSFLVKHLLINWQHGEEWFWDTLVDADQANNPVAWQWIAGSGADAAPFYRVFNPILQSRKFDPDGTYIRSFCPELAALNNSQIHEPWTVTPMELKSAGIILGKTYPHPIVDHQWARQRALAMFAKVKSPSCQDSARQPKLPQ